MIIIFIWMIIIIRRNYFILLQITIIMEIQGGVGCRMGGLWQACAQTIHGYYILGLRIPFYVCLNCYCMRRHEKVYEYNNDVRYVWYEQQQQQQQQQQYCEFCSF